MVNIVIKGKVKRGLRIASGLNPDPTLKFNNTIALQKPFFKEANVSGVDQWFNGTINVDIAPYQFKILEPDHEVTCEWVPGTMETFHLVRVVFDFKEHAHAGYIYYPCPSTIKSHPDDTIELLSEKVDSINYGDSISIRVPEGRVRLVEV